MSDRTPPEGQVPPSPEAGAPIPPPQPGQAAPPPPPPPPTTPTAAAAPDGVPTAQPVPSAEGEERPGRSFTGRLLLVIAGAVVLVIGVAALVIGLQSAATATSDRDAAQADLEAAQSELAAAEEDLTAAQNELNAILAEANNAISDGEQAVTVASQLCDCDGRKTDLVTQWKAAADSGDLAAFDALAGEINAESDEANRLLVELRAALGVSG